MSLSIIIAWGLEVPHTTRQQLSNTRACIEQLSKDPRVRSIYGAAGQSTGVVVMADVHSEQDSMRLASLMQVWGLPHTQVIPLIEEQQLRSGLEEAEKVNGNGSAREAFSTLVGVPC